MGSEKRIRRILRIQKDGIDAVADVTANIATNVGERGSRTEVHSKSTSRVVQRSGETHVETDGSDGASS